MRAVLGTRELALDLKTKSGTMERTGEQLPFAEFVDVQQEPLRPKASIHKSGKLGFNSDAEEFMELQSGMEFQVARLRDAPPEEVLFLIPSREEYPDRSRVRVAKAGDYYYIHLRNYFDLAGVDYDGNKYRYEIRSETRDGVELYVLENDMSKPR